MFKAFRQTVAVSTPAVPNGDEVVGTLSRAVQALGEREFPQVFLAFVAETLDFDMCSAFTLDRTGNVRVLLAAGWTPGSSASAYSASNDYAETFWRTDPSLADGFGTTTAPSVFCQSRTAIRDDRYRITCYENPGVVERLTLRVRVEDDLTQIGLYRFHDRGAFEQADLRRLEQVGGLVAALAAKHGSILLRQSIEAAFPDLAAVTARLMQAAAGLSLREAEVCAAILCGNSAKEAAKLLGVEPSTIITYRKRAFLKFGIARSRDLQRLYNEGCPPSQGTAIFPSVA